MKASRSIPPINVAFCTLAVGDIISMKVPVVVAFCIEVVVVAGVSSVVGGGMMVGVSFCDGVVGSCVVTVTVVAIEVAVYVVVPSAKNIKQL